MTTAAIAYDPKGKGRAEGPAPDASPAASPAAHDYQHAYYTADPEQRAIADWWLQSRERARTDKKSWDYIISSGIAGGVAGCVAKTAIAPLDRVKILFQTSNAEFRKYAGTPMGLINATGHIYRTSGVLGLLQGHSATLLRIFPYAGVKFMAYDWAESKIINTPEKRTPLRFFVAGAFSGVTSVLLTYPLELIRVRLAYQTKAHERTSLMEAVKSIYAEGQRPAGSAGPVGSAGSAVSSFTRSLPIYPFYRGFSISLVGMVPYAGVSFLTYGTLKRHINTIAPYFRDRKTARDLFCGALAGAVSQTASYPFEVLRRRMQVSGVNGGHGVTAREAAQAIYRQGGWRAFFVGLSIGYIKVIPMTSISFTTWQYMRRLLEI